MSISPNKQAKDEFIKALASAVKTAYPQDVVTDDQLALSISKAKPGFGDLSSAISFSLAKRLKKSPLEISRAIASMAVPSGLISHIGETAGYVNAKLNELEYARLVISAINERKEFYGLTQAGQGKKVIVEGPSVNPNKPWHIGHLRNALLGDAISNILAANACNVERINYIDDLGLQVAESLWGVKHLGNAPDGKFDQWLGEQYVLVNKKMEDDKSIANEIKLLNEKMESPSSPESAEARNLAGKCVRAQYETNASYGISHDLLVWESDIVSGKLLEKALSIMDSKGMLEKPVEGKYANCITLPLEKAKGFAKEFENPAEETKVLVRSNGTATYVAKDIAFHMWKFGLIADPFAYEPFIEKQPNGKALYTTSASGVAALFGKADMIVNIIGTKQSYAQLILKAAFSMAGYGDIANNIIHLAYGEVSIEGGSLSGRKGGWIGGEGRSYTADSLLTEVRKKTLEIVEKSEKIEDKRKSSEIANAVALGAIKFEFLRIAPEKQVTFSWERALSFESNSAPYCMYTYARSKRILERAAYIPMELKDSDYKQMQREADFDLAKLLGEAQDIVEKAGSEYRPNVITDYLLDLATLFSRFYERMPVIKGGSAKDLRLSLVAATMQVTKNMLLLLGIGTVDSM